MSPFFQEVSSGPAGRLPEGLETGSRRHWDSYTWTADYPEGRFSTWCKRWPMIVKMSDRVEVEWFEQVGPDSRPSENEITVSDVGLIAAARVTPKDLRDGEPFIAVSMYAQWNPEDLAVLSSISIVTDIGSVTERDVPASDRILAAGDLNVHYRPGAYSDFETRTPVDILADQFGYSYRIYEEGDRFTVVLHRPNGEAFDIRRMNWKTLWGVRGWAYKNMETFTELRRKVVSGETEVEPGVWKRMDNMGLEFMGPQSPNGRQAHPVPDYLPSDTGNVVTFHRPAQTVQDADQQLDYVFASQGFHESFTTSALNSVEEWGSSDHCRILIEIVSRLRLLGALRSTPMMTTGGLMVWCSEGQQHDDPDSDTA